MNSKTINNKTNSTANVCNICPRNCKINRNKQAGFCSIKTLTVAKVMRHFWEEPIISGAKGSGAIFFSGCNLKCVFCQNSEISHETKGKKITPLELVDIFKKIEQANCENINLVSPTQFTSEILQALKIYKPKIPVVWNTNSFEKVSTLKKLKDYVDIYLADYKYSSGTLSQKYSFANTYPQTSQKAIKKMRKNQPNDIIENGLMKKGLIVRHLILPNAVKNSYDCLDWINANLGNKTYVSIMSQFTPYYKVKQIPELSRKITPLEHKAVLNKAQNINFQNCYYQDLTSAQEEYIPNFKTFWEL